MSDPFGEQWFCEQSQDLLADLGRSVANVDGLIIEIGSWTGRSTCALASAVYPRVVHAVDTWQGSPGEISSDLASQRDVFAQWSANVAAFTKGNVVAHRMGWREYIPQIDQPVAMVFIDAEHTEVEVRENIQAVHGLVASSGVICGDDVHHAPVRAGVASMLKVREVNVGATLWWWRKP
jgi:predicted O-methyltransferase YrrM